MSQPIYAPVNFKSVLIDKRITKLGLSKEQATSLLFDNMPAHALKKIKEKSTGRWKHWVYPRSYGLYCMTFCLHSPEDVTGLNAMLDDLKILKKGGIPKSWEDQAPTEN